MCKDECDLIWSGSFQNPLMKESFGVLIYASKAACVDVYTYVVGPSIPHQSRRFSHATHPPLIPHTTALHAPRRSSSSPIVIVIIIAEQTFVPRNGQNPPSLGALALATRVWWMDGWMPGSPPARPSVPLSPQKMSRPPIPVAHPPLPHSNWGCRRRRCFGGNSRVGG